MRKIIQTSQFKKNYKAAIKRGKRPEKLMHIIEELKTGNTLPAKNKNHKLKGEYADCWECHIEPDWLLIYQISSTELTLVGMGSHSDLF